MAHRFEADRLEGLDNPLRKLFMPPRKALSRLGLKSGDCLIDIGAGSGYFALPASDVVGSSGRVFAVDIQPEAIEILERKKKEGNRENLHPILSSDQDLGLGDGSGNLAIMYTVLHEVPDRSTMLSLIYKALASGGSIAIVEFSGKALFGPAPEERIGEEEMLNLLGKAGFKNPAIESWSALHYLARAYKPA